MATSTQSNDNSFTARVSERPSATIVACPVSGEKLLHEIEEKMKRVREFLEAENLGGVLLTEVRNFSWITAGIADNHIVLTSEAGAASLLLMRDGRKYLVANGSETPRLMSEDLKGLGYEALEYKWYEDSKLQLVNELARGAPVGTDTAFEDLQKVDLAPLRFRLTDSEIEKYRWLGRHTSDAVAAVCRQLQPGISEREIEAFISDELMRRCIRPTVLLIGTDERLYKFRHATPTDALLDKYAMVNVCARKWGLVVAVTRFVHFGTLPDELKARLSAAVHVNAQFQAHTTPGMKASDLFEMSKKWYAESGFPGEWEFHHQGGAIGYAERDWLALPQSSEVVEERQAFAWNPTVQGAKVEDTIIAYEDHTENITATDDWPTIATEIDGRTYESPDILVR